MTFQEQVGRITAEDKFLYASESEIRKLLGDNPLSPAQMEGVCELTCTQMLR